MIKTLFLFGALLALPLRAATLPLSAETKAYADTLTGLTFCFRPTWKRRGACSSIR